MPHDSRSKHTPVSRSGGVDISGHARVDVGGDIVGANKIEGAANAQQIEQLFEQLSRAIEGTSKLPESERKRLGRATEELQGELKSAEPDLGKLERLKRDLVSRGGEIATVTSAIFSYGPVQDTIRSAMQRLLGG
jgi:hypothetical protein